jgi:hypothetical protein
MSRLEPLCRCHLGILQIRTYLNFELLLGSICCIIKYVGVIPVLYRVGVPRVKTDDPKVNKYLGKI